MKMTNSASLHLLLIWMFSFLVPGGLTGELLFAQTARSFNVTLDKNVAEKAVNGRLMVFVSRRNRRPMNGPNWFQPEPFFGLDVINVSPGDTIKINDTADGFPGVLSELPNGKYFVQAILDHDFYSANHANGAGNFYSQPQQLTIGDQPLAIQLDQVIPPTIHKDNEHVKFVRIQSKLLSDFHGREVFENAMVVLPASYDSQDNRRYPVYYDITGFGGTLSQLKRRWSRGQSPAAPEHAEFIRVYLTGQCKWGHHVYANSATNGPRGDALTQEMIPEIDRRFRTIDRSTARFVGGHSSGGWSSLWLQVAYPDFFGGVWSTSPDPVDFRNWQGTNLYAKSANVYVDEAGQKRPLARFGNRIMAYYQDFTQMDDVLGRGGQIRSFDAVFSPKMDNGQPAYCWDRKTGLVDTKVLEHWKKYDISLILKNNWPTLGPKLKSKIHVMMGDKDTFYLEGATIKLGERMKELGSDAVIELFPGKDHSNILSPQLKKRILKEMSEQFWMHHPETKPAPAKKGT